MCFYIESIRAVWLSSNRDLKIIISQPRKVINYWYLLISTSLQTLIAIRQLKGPHTGENQAEIIIQVIQEFHLHKHVGYFVTDNASNNDTAIDIVVAYFFPNMPTKQRRARRLRCLGHVINLSAKAFLFWHGIWRVWEGYRVYKGEVGASTRAKVMAKAWSCWQAP